MRKAFVAIAVAAMFACGTATPYATTSALNATGAREATFTPASPAPSPTGPGSSGIYAIMRGPGNGLDLVNEAGGNVTASVQYLPAKFAPNAFMPSASASLTRAYYLKAGSEVRWLAPDGTGGFATNIQVSTNQQAGFAVSPDDKRIAVSIFSYGPLAQGDLVPPYLGMRMYVEDLAGGDHHVDIFTSNALAEFPIGWVGGNLLVAVSFPHCCQGPPSLGNPYLASSYHVVDPGTGRRLATICRSGLEPEGPVEPVGA